MDATVYAWKGHDRALSLRGARTTRECVLHRHANGMYASHMLLGGVDKKARQICRPVLLLMLALSVGCTGGLIWQNIFLCSKPLGKVFSLGESRAVVPLLREGGNRPMCLATNQRIGVETAPLLAAYRTQTGRQCPGIEG